MLLRLSIVFFLSYLCPAQASLPPTAQQQAPCLKTVFRIAQNEMPLPVLRVLSWPLRKGTQRYVIEMSTAGLARVKSPIMHITFEIPEDGNGLEQALIQASALTRAFIAATTSEPGFVVLDWRHIDPQQAARAVPFR
jgi:hypothetical protein